jgi:hypothetical protein
LASASNIASGDYKRSSLLRSFTLRLLPNVESLSFLGNLLRQVKNIHCEEQV